MVEDPGHGNQEFILADLVGAPLCKFGEYLTQIEALLHHSFSCDSSESLNCVSVLFTQLHDPLSDLFSHGIHEVRPSPILTTISVGEHLRSIDQSQEVFVIHGVVQGCSKLLNNIENLSGLQDVFCYFKY